MHAQHSSGRAASRQQIDSALQRLSTYPPASATRAATLGWVGRQFSVALPDSGVYYHRLAASAYEQLEQPGKYIDQLLSISGVYREAGDYALAKQSAYRAKRVAEQRELPVRLAYAYNDLGLVHRRALEFDSAVLTGLNAIHLLHEHASDEVDLLSRFYTSLGRSFLEQHNRSDAEEAFETAWQLADRNREDVARYNRGMPLYFLGTMHMEAGNIEAAEYAMLRYQKFAEERDDVAGMYRSGNHGALALFMRDTALATKYYREFHLQAISEDNPKRVAIACSNLAALALDAGNLDEALLLGHEALDNVVDDLETVNFVLPMIARAHHGLGNLDSANYYLQRVETLHDSLGTALSRTRLEDLRAAFKSEQATTERLQDNADSEVSSSKSYLWLLASALGVGAIAVYFIRLRKVA